MKSSYLETIKSVDGKLFNISYHQKRYESVLNSLGVSTCRDLSSLINPPLDGLYMCRIVYTCRDVKVTYHEYIKREIKSLKLVYDDNIDYSFKASDRENINRLFAQRDNCDDILIVKNSLLTDISIANIALFSDGIWYTPKDPLLKGTTRERLLNEGKLVEKALHVEDIYNYSKIAILNAMIDFDIITQESIRKIIC